MNKTIGEAEQFLSEVKDKVPASDQVDSIICAPFLALPSLVEAAKGTNVKIGAQNMHYEDNGAFTGEISPVMLQDLGVQYVVIGHSERREMFNETDETVNKKVKAAFAKGLVPIVCVGEALDQRESGETKALVEAQVKAGLAGLSENQVKQTVIAYEPIWAIGTGKTASSDDANEVCAHIRHVVKQEFSEAAAEAVRIQYGGSEIGRAHV